MRQIYHQPIQMSLTDSELFNFVCGIITGFGNAGGKGGTTTSDTELNLGRDIYVPELKNNTTIDYNFHTFEGATSTIDVVANEYKTTALDSSKPGKIRFDLYLTPDETYIQELRTLEDFRLQFDVYNWNTQFRFIKYGSKSYYRLPDPPFSTTIIAHEPFKLYKDRVSSHVVQSDSGTTFFVGEPAVITLEDAENIDEPIELRPRMHVATVYVECESLVRLYSYEGSQFTYLYNGIPVLIDGLTVQSYMITEKDDVRSKNLIYFNSWLAHTGSRSITEEWSLDSGVTNWTDLALYERYCKNGPWSYGPGRRIVNEPSENQKQQGTDMQTAEFTLRFKSDKATYVKVYCGTKNSIIRLVEGENEITLDFVSNSKPLNSFRYEVLTDDGEVPANVELLNGSTMVLKLPATEKLVPRIAKTIEDRCSLAEQVIIDILSVDKPDAADKLNLTDDAKITILSILNKSLAEFTGLTDTAQISILKTLREELSEQTTISDIAELLIEGLIKKKNSEQLSLTDSARLNILQNIVSISNEQLSLTDSAEITTNN